MRPFATDTAVEMIEGPVGVHQGGFVRVILVDRARRADVDHDLRGLGEVERIAAERQQVAGTAVRGEAIVVESPPGTVAQHTGVARKAGIPCACRSIAYDGIARVTRPRLQVPRRGEPD